MQTQSCGCSAARGTRTNYTITDSTAGLLQATLWDDTSLSHFSTFSEIPQTVQQHSLLRKGKHNEAIKNKETTLAEQRDEQKPDREQWRKQRKVVF